MRTLRPAQLPDSLDPPLGDLLHIAQRVLRGGSVRHVPGQLGNFGQVDPTLGTNADLERLTAAMRKRGMSLCLDFVLNHTAGTHEWALRAKAGERDYIDRYICYDTPDIPREFEKTVPDVFPQTAPGSFIWVDEMQKYVWVSGGI